MAGPEDRKKGLEVTLKFQERDIAVGKNYFDVHPQKPWIIFVAASAENIRSPRVCNYEDGQQVAIAVPSTAYSDCTAKFLARNDWVVVVVAAGWVWELIIYQISQTCGLQMALREIRAVRSLVAQGNLGNWTVHSSAQCVLLGAARRGTDKIYFWDLDRGSLRETGFTETCITTMGFHCLESHTFATAHENGAIKIWDAAEMAVLKQFKAESQVTSIQFCAKPQKSLIITAHKSGKLQVWDYQRAECMTICKAHMRPAVQAFFHPHLPYILSASEHGTIKLWNDSNYQLEKTLCNGLEGLESAVLCRNRSMLVLPCKERLRFITFITVEGVTSSMPHGSYRTRLRAGGTHQGLKARP